MEATTFHEQASPLLIASGFAALFIVSQICSALYNIYFHPLCHIPGPWYAVISYAPYARSLIKGDVLPYLSDLHERYGDVVRYSPSEVSCISGESAWQDIYGFRTGKQKGTATFPKDRVWYPHPPNDAPSLFIADDASHTRQRRVLSHAFSEKALREQEGLLHKYTDLFINRMKEVTSGSNKIVDMSDWTKWTTFDIISDLMFGEPFGCLQRAETHKYVQLLTDGIRGSRFRYVMIHFPWAKYLGSLILNKKAMARRLELNQWAYAQTEKRCAQETQRPDFITQILAHNDQKDQGSRITQDEINATSIVLLAAGTEGTAHAISAATYLLLQNPVVMRKLKEEVRGRFTKNDDITIDAVNDLHYTVAVLTEVLRFSPPTPAGFPRTAPLGGGTVSGHYIPEKTSVSVSQYVAYHSRRNFTDPDAFVPERWLGDERYKDDNRATFQPFSFGPRNCLGKNLAYAEMRLLLAKLIFHFDMELQERSSDWMDRLKVMPVWADTELAVRLTAVVQ